MRTKGWWDCTKLIPNRTVLLRELIRIAETDECRNTRIIALALAFIVNDIVPDGRTTERVVKHSTVMDKIEEE